MANYRRLVHSFLFCSCLNGIVQFQFQFQFQFPVRKRNMFHERHFRAKRRRTEATSCCCCFCCCCFLEQVPVEPNNNKATTTRTSCRPILDLIQKLPMLTFWFQAARQADRLAVPPLGPGSGSELLSGGTSTLPSYCLIKATKNCPDNADAADVAFAAAAAAAAAKFMRLFGDVDKLVFCR